MNQKQMILKHLQDFGRITSAEAVTEYGIFRLASRIHDLQNEGYAIGKKTIQAVNRFGKKVCFTEYSLIC